MLDEDPSIIHLLLRYNCNCNSIRNTLSKSDRDTCICYMGVCILYWERYFGGYFGGVFGGTIFYVVLRPS